MSSALACKRQNLYETRGSPTRRSERVSWTIPAVVVGAGECGLGIVRSLGTRGVPVIVVDDDSRHLGMHSRYAYPFKVGGTSGQDLIEGLLALRAQLSERPVLFLTLDDQVEAVSRDRAQLDTAFRLRLPDHDLICQLLHKSSFQAMAERHQFPVPRSVVVRNNADLSSLAVLRFPAVIKAGKKALIGADKAPRAYRVFSQEQAEAICRDITPRAPDLIVQEWIDGAESDIFFCLQYRDINGATVNSFTGRKLRSWPPQTGSTASCTAAPGEAAVLESLTTAFFDKAGFVGMGSMEFKRERFTGKFFMIEPTVGRADGQEEVATLHGVNIPLTAYCCEVGLPLPGGEAAPHPVILRTPTGYWRSVLASRSFRDQSPVGAKVVSAVWRIDDPWPLPFCWLQWLRKAWRNAVAAAGVFRSRCGLGSWTIGPRAFGRIARSGGEERRACMPPEQDLTPANGQVTPEA